MASNYYLSANMNLPVPTVGQDPGPDYASNVNAALTLVDTHNHSSGQGVQINPSGLNINADLPFNGNNLITARSLRFTPQSAPIGNAADLGCLYESGVDLYYNDGNGNQVRITQSGGVAGSPGSIANLVSPASATYVGADQTFVWQSAASTPANMDGGSVIIRNVTASSNGITISAPVALASSFAITLPLLPASQKFMTLDASGNMAAPWSVDNSTIEVAANLVQVKDLGITTAKLAAGAVTAAKIASATITGTQVSSNINLPGTAVQESGKNIVVSNANASASLAIIRATISGAGAVIHGEGIASVTNIGAGIYLVAFDANFADVPTAVVTVDSATTYASVSSVGIGDVTINIAGGNNQFCLIVIGQRI